MITYSDLEIESCQLTGGSSSCLKCGAGIQHQTMQSSKLGFGHRRVTFN